MAQSTRAPGQLEVVRAFVNTRDVEEGTDRLATIDGLRSWLGDAGLLGDHETSGGATEEDRLLAVSLRESLRALMLANNDGRPLDEDTLTDLRQVASAGAVSLTVSPDGRLALDAPTPGVRGALSRLLLIVERSMAEGSWRRLKACRDDTCQWGFYDQSKNQSRAWCSMEVCGSRNKARAYRRRHAEHEAHT